MEDTARLGTDGQVSIDDLYSQKMRFREVVERIMDPVIVEFLKEYPKRKCKGKKTHFSLVILGILGNL